MAEEEKIDVQVTDSPPEEVPSAAVDAPHAASNAIGPSPEEVDRTVLAELLFNTSSDWDFTEVDFKLPSQADEPDDKPEPEPEPSADPEFIRRQAELELKDKVREAIRERERTANPKRFLSQQDMLAVVPWYMQQMHVPQHPDEIARKEAKKNRKKRKKKGGELTEVDDTPEEFLQQRWARDMVNALIGFVFSLMAFITPTWLFAKNTWLSTYNVRVIGFYSLGVWYYCAAYGTECKDPCTAEDFVVWKRENSYKDNCWSTLSITPSDDYVLKACQSGVFLSVFFSGQLIYAFYQLKFKKSVRIASSGAACGLVSATFAILSAVQAPDRLKSLSDVVDEFEGLTFDWQSYNFSWYSGVIGAAANCYSSWILVSCHIESVRQFLESAGKADGDDSSSDDEEGQVNKAKIMDNLSGTLDKITTASKDLDAEKQKAKANKKATSGNKVKHHRRSVVAKDEARKEHKKAINKTNRNKI